jgi:hypothetical protein
MNNREAPEQEVIMAKHTTAETASTTPVIVAGNRTELLSALSQLSPGTRNVRVRIPNAATVGSPGHTLRRELATLMQKGAPVPTAEPVTQVIKQRGGIAQLLTHLTNLMELARSNQTFRTTNIRLTATQLGQLQNHEVAALQLRMSQCLPLGVFGDTDHARALLAIVTKEYNKRQGVDDEDEDSRTSGEPDEDTVDLLSPLSPTLRAPDGSITRTMPL